MKKFKQHIVDQQLIDGSIDNQLELVKQGVENGANIHIFDDIALLNSAYRGHSEIIKYLIDNGAKINFANFGKSNPNNKVVINNICKIMGQEYIFKNYPEYVKYIENPLPGLVTKYSNVKLMRKFDLFGEK